MGIEKSKTADTPWISVWIKREKMKVMHYDSPEFMSMEIWCEENCKTYMFSQISFYGDTTFLIIRFSTESDEEIAKEEAAWFKMIWQ